MRAVQIVLALPLLLTATLISDAQVPPAKSEPAPAPAPTPQPRTPVSVSLKKTVVFLKVIYRDGIAIKTSEGTGFFVSIPDARLEKGREFSYFVSNRHMADPSIIEGHAVQVLGFSILANRILPAGDLGTPMVEIPVPGFAWVFPQDPSVDLAVAPFGLDQAKIDYLHIPESMFATQDIVKSREISEGDSVLFTGFFAQFPGQQRIQPVIREGVLAMLPDEKIPTTLNLPGHLYLADLHSFHGNSGSPVYVNLSGIRNGALYSGQSYLLLGVISGYMYETADLQLQVATTLAGKVGANSGITTIVPIDELKSVLDSPQLARQRDAAAAAETTHSTDAPRPNF